ncbi:MAG: hypothetical protein HY922_17710 [Elusimicrobia bacterium]|nr:hypothetical protein [Elusimicrobiota bacterium]
MSKSKKKVGKKPAAVAPAATEPKAPAGPTPKPMLRAIRVTQEVLDAAKAYKKATGKSFYALGLEAITEVLKHEGYLKTAESKA